MANGYTEDTQGAYLVGRMVNEGGAFININPALSYEDVLSIAFDLQHGDQQWIDKHPDQTAEIAKIKVGM